MSRYIRLILFCSLVACGLVSCNDGANYAPVTELSAMDPIPQSGYHRVLPGETLYEIAWRYGLDYRYLAARNKIAAPYTIHVNDQIALQGHTATVIESRPTLIAEKVPTPQIQQIKETAEVNSEPLDRSINTHAELKRNETTVEKMIIQEPRFKVTQWLRPAKGPTINFFSSHQKGIDIAGTRGESVVAAADGKVVYSGSGLKRYGNLIIIKHNHLYLSAYAHNQRMYVREGEWVKQGQKIAEMGNTGTNKVMLHFEIRKAGKPINPSTLLGS